eukprot:6788940-Prymnesium_polylepis.1
MSSIDGGASRCGLRHCTHGRPALGPTRVVQSTSVASKARQCAPKPSGSSARAAAHARPPRPSTDS